MTPLPVSRAGRSLSRGRRSAVGLAILVVAGFAFRWTTTRVETLLSSDSCQYLRLAEALASGHGYASGGSEHPDLTRLPVFPALVAATGAVGGNFEGAARFLVTLASALMPVPMWWLGRRIFGPDAAWAAAALGAFSCLHGIAGFLLPDPIALLWLLAASASAADAARRPSPRGFVRTGVLAALAALTRSEAILLPPLLALAVALTARRRRLAGAALVLACATALYAPYVAWASWKLGRFAPAPGIEYVRGARELSDRLGLRWIGDPEVSWNDKARYMLDREGRHLLLESFFLSRRVPEISEVPSVPAPHADGRTDAQRTRDELLRRWRILVGNSARLPSLLRDEHLVPAVPWIFAVAGGLLALSRRSARRVVAVLLAAGAAAAAPYYSHVEPRFGYALFAGALIFAAGAWGALQAALGRYGARVRVAAGAIVLVAMLFPSLDHDPRAGARSARRLLQQAIGAEAGRALPAGPILAIRPLVPYFADRPYRALPLASPDRVLGFARAVGAAGIVLEGSLDRAERPELSAWFGDEDPPGLRRVVRRDDPEGGAFLVYALEPDPR